MNQLERNKSILRKYIPESAIDTIAAWIVKYNFKLKIKKSRSSKQGDYTSPHSGKNHVITINYDLNKYAFLVTLIHEVAHLITWEKYHGKVNPHGREWKSEYSKLLSHFLEMNNARPMGQEQAEEFLFPEEVFHALKRHMLSPSAASCSDLHLSRVLKKFDTDKQSLLLEKIARGSSFRIANARSKHSSEVFIKGEKRRTRFRCLHTRTKKEYFIHALCEVVIDP